MDTSLLSELVIIYFKLSMLNVVPTGGPLGGITTTDTVAVEVSPSLSVIV